MGGHDRIYGGSGSNYYYAPLCNGSMTIDAADVTRTTGHDILIVSMRSTSLELYTYGREKNNLQNLFFDLAFRIKKTDSLCHSTTTFVSAFSQNSKALPTGIVIKSIKARDDEEYRKLCYEKPASREKKLNETIDELSKSYQHYLDSAKQRVEDSTEHLQIKKDNLVVDNLEGAVHFTTDHINLFQQHYDQVIQLFYGTLRAFASLSKCITLINLNDPSFFPKEFSYKIATNAANANRCRSLVQQGATDTTEEFSIFDKLIKEKSELLKKALAGANIDLYLETYNTILEKLKDQEAKLLVVNRLIGELSAVIDEWQNANEFNISYHKQINTFSINDFLTALHRTEYCVYWCEAKNYKDEVPPGYSIEAIAQQLLTQQFGYYQKFDDCDCEKDNKEYPSFDMIKHEIFNETFTDSEALCLYESVFGADLNNQQVCMLS